MMGFHGMPRPEWAPTVSRRRSSKRRNSSHECDSDCSCEDCCVCEETPGPGTYNIPSCFNSGPAYTMKGKPKYEEKEPLPGAWLACWRNVGPCAAARRRQLSEIPNGHV